MDQPTTPNRKTDSTEKPFKSVLRGFIVLFGFSALAGYKLLAQAFTPLFIGAELLLIWSFFVALIAYFYLIFEPQSTDTISKRSSRFARIWQWIILILVLALGYKFISPSFIVCSEINLVPYNTLRLAALLFLTFGCITHLFSSYAHSVHTRSQSLRPNHVLHIGRIVFIACAITSALLFLFLSTNLDYCGRWGWVLTGITGGLLLESILLFAGRFYRPKSLRKNPLPIGSSLILDVLCDSGGRARGTFKDFEGLIGMNLKEIWILCFLHRTIEGVLLAGLLLGWCSTALTAVPLGCRGVMVSFGHYTQPVLDPGLHVTLPWPFQSIIIVESERLRDVSLGFDKDLMTPVLWTEQHVEGEKNLLVDNGESLLAINVPISYRISDPVSYLKSSTDAEMALKTLAERKLTQIAANRESFHFMTEDRQAIATALKEGIQSEINRKNLGLEIVYLGLKDIHPPVTVASAYQRVISSQEEMETMVDKAKAYEASTLPQANSQANTLIVNAGATYTQRISLAEGEARRFKAVIASEKINPDLFRIRLSYDALTETLPIPNKTIVSSSIKGASEYFLDLRLRGEGISPAELSPQ